MQQGLFLRQHGQLLHQQRRRLPIVQPARSASVRAQPDAYPDLDAFVNKIAAMNSQTVADFKVTQNQTLADFKVSSNQVVDKAVYELKLEYQRLQFICAAVIAAVALGAGSDSLLGQFASLIITKLLK